jgi:hypothetical protein
MFSAKSMLEAEPDATVEIGSQPEPNTTVEIGPQPEPIATVESKPNATAEPDTTAEPEPEPDALAFMDTSRPLLPQVLFNGNPMTGAAYMDAVFGHVQYSVTSIQLLPTVLEPWVRTTPAAVCKFWLPVVAALFAASLLGHTVGETLLGTTVGAALWVPLEYAMHRFVFHGLGKVVGGNPVLRTAHFALHGVHHRYPRAGVLLLPPWSAAGLGAPILTLLLLVLGWAALPVFAGCACAYLGYDFAHSLMHERKVDVQSWLEPLGGRAVEFVQGLRTAHMQHHATPDHGFGITSRMMDHACGTALPKPRLVPAATATAAAAAAATATATATATASSELRAHAANW